MLRICSGAPRHVAKSGQVGAHHVLLPQCGARRGKGRRGPYLRRVRLLHQPPSRRQPQHLRLLRRRSLHYRSLRRQPLRLPPSCRQPRPPLCVCSLPSLRRGLRLRNSSFLRSLHHRPGSVVPLYDLHPISNPLSERTGSPNSELRPSRWQWRFSFNTRSKPDGFSLPCRWAWGCCCLLPW